MFSYEIDFYTGLSECVGVPRKNKLNVPRWVDLFVCSACVCRPDFSFVPWAQKRSILANTRFSMLLYIWLLLLWRLMVFFIRSRLRKQSQRNVDQLWLVLLNCILLLSTIVCCCIHNSKFMQMSFKCKILGLTRTTPYNHPNKNHISSYTGNQIISLYHLIQINLTYAPYI
jgi:hypothetical protein